MKGRVPQLIKIDVEGFEQAVIDGAPKTLAESDLLALVIELNGQGRRYGFDEDALHDQMLTHGFRSVTYRPFQHALADHDADGYAPGNRLYVREGARAEIEERLRTAPPFEVKGKRI